MALLCHRQAKPSVFVPRMLRNAPRLRRGALLIRGPWVRYAAAWVPALQCSAKGAAPRPGHESSVLEFQVRLLLKNRDDMTALSRSPAEDHEPLS